MSLFRKPNRKEAVYLILVILVYLSVVVYVYVNELSFPALFRYGLLQQPGVTGEEARFADIDTPVSWNIPLVLWFIYIKGAAVLAELFQYWIIGMLLAGILVAFVPWEKVKQKMGYGNIKANFLAAIAGAVIPICSCGIVPVLAGMVKAGIPLGPTMAFLIAAPMINIPAVFITATMLGVPLAIGRILGTFFIALVVGTVLSYMQRRKRFLRRFIKAGITASLSPGLQQLAFQAGMKLSGGSQRMTTEELAPGEEEKLMQEGCEMSESNKAAQVNVFMLPLEYPCGPESTCCGPLGQSEEEIEEIKKAVESELGLKVQVIDAADRKTVEAQPEGQAIVQLLSSFGAQALPVIALNGGVVSMGSPSPRQAVDTIKGKMS